MTTPQDGLAEDGNDIAEFAYDALGRRIRKIDSDANETTHYYYNNNWQVLCEYDGSGTFKAWYAYGNYIDEVLMRCTSIAPTFTKFYVHDHLHSPAALAAWAGAVVERYEYDAYGSPYILEPNFAADPDGKSDYDNPYMFTGRRVDLLDSGSLTLQYNRHRYYDYYTGRWMMEDPLGINPAGGDSNPFTIRYQYEPSLGLYEYVESSPVLEGDLYGLAPTKIVWDSKKHCIKEFHVYGHGLISPNDPNWGGGKKKKGGSKLPTTARQEYGANSEKDPSKAVYFSVRDHAPNGRFCCNATIRLWGCYVGNNAFAMWLYVKGAGAYNPDVNISVCACRREVNTPSVIGKWPIDSWSWCVKGDWNCKTSTCKKK
ncbi:MAG: RHS repeat domain-containing protein [Planctomycetota bacterium]